MTLTFLKFVTDDHSNSIYSSPICHSIGGKGNSFLYYTNTNCPNFKPALKTQAVRTLEK